MRALMLMGVYAGQIIIVDDLFAAQGVIDGWCRDTNGLKYPYDSSGMIVKTPRSALPASYLAWATAGYPASGGGGGGGGESTVLFTGEMSFVSLGDSIIGQAANCKGMSNFTALLLYYLKALFRLTNASDQGIGGNRMDQMFTRINYIAAQLADVVGFGGGRNDLSASDPLATLQSEHSSNVNALWAVKPSTIVMRWCLFPSTADSAPNGVIRDNFNAWLASQEKLTGSNRMIFFPVPAGFNPAIHTVDGTHLNKLGSRLYVVSILAKIAPYIDAAYDVFASIGAAGQHGANLDTETALTGTSGTKTGTVAPTGNVAAGKNVNNLTTAAVACSLVSNGDGTFTQIIKITGTVSAQGLVQFGEQAASTVTINALIGDNIEHFVNADCTATDGVSPPVGVLGWADVAGTLGQHFTTALVDTDTVNYPLLGGVLRTWPQAARAVTATVTPTVSVLLAAGPVDVQLSIKRPRARMTELVPYAQPTYQGSNGIKVATETLRLTGTLVSGAGTLTAEPGTHSGGGGNAMLGARRIYKGGTSAIGSGALLATLTGQTYTWVAAGVATGDTLYLEIDTNNGIGSAQTTRSAAYTAA
jgi:hypothetical protein